MYSCVELANGSGVSFAIREAGSIVAAMLAGRARPVAGRSAIPWSTPAHDVLGRRPKDLDRANELAVKPPRNSSALKPPRNHLFKNSSRSRRRFSEVWEWCILI
jgi:hypothetical protein